MPPGVGVAVSGGVVTLTGHVPTYAERYAAERAAHRVAGVVAVADEIEVRLLQAHKTEDDEIAHRAASILKWDVRVPDGVHVTVRNGWLTLAGKVNWQFQRQAAGARCAS